MLKFSGGEWFNISGRGRIYTCKVTQEDFTLSQVYQQTVEIEGEEYFVTSVDYFRNRELKVGSPIGLVVREKKE